MDKKSNRTDLLAAGRKKLQQYRQKKDNKGKDVKANESKGGSRSSSKTDWRKHGDDTGVGSATFEANTASLQQSREGSALHHNCGSSATDSVDEYPDTGVIVKVANPSLALASADAGEVAIVSAGDVEFPVEDSMMEEISMSHKVAPAHEADAPIIIGERKANVDMPEDEGASAGSSPFISALGVVPVEAHKEAQVSDVGAMQEADASEPYNPNRSILLNATHSLSVATSHDCAHIPSAAEVTHEDLTALESEQSQKVDVYSPGSDEEYICARVTPLAVKMLPESPGYLHSEGEYLGAGSSIREAASGLHVVCSQSEYHIKELGKAPAAGMLVDEGDRQRLLWVQSNMSAGDSDENCLRIKGVDLTTCSSVSSSSMSLVHLAEVLKGLPEDDFKFLIKSREAADTSSISVPNDSGVDVAQAFQELLYLANISKDFFYLELTEQTSQNYDSQHHQLSSDISMLTASLADFQEKNQYLDAELAQCRSKLQAAVSEKEIHQQRLHALESEVKEYSVKVDELTLKLEESASHTSDLSVELTTCNDLLATLRTENEKQSGTVASLYEEIKQVETSREHDAAENRKLLVELNDCKNSLSALQIELADFNASFTCLLDEKRKLDEEKEFVVHDNMKLLVDLDDCRHILATLQVENSKLNVKLAAVIEEQKMLEEAKDHLVIAKEKLSAELDVSEEMLSSEHGKCTRLEDDMLEMSSRLRQLTKENATLVDSLKLHEAKTTEVDTKQILPRSVESENLFRDLRSMSAAADSAGISVTQPIDDGASDKPGMVGFVDRLVEHVHGASELVTLEVHLAKVQKWVLELDNTVEEMQSHSASLSRSSGKPVAPGVSKLIQAFESKSYSDDHEPDSVPPTGVQVSADPYFSAKDLIKNLKALLRTMSQDIEHADGLLRIEKNGRQLADVALAELAQQFEAAEDCSINLELRNIELEVLYKAIKQHMWIMESKNEELWTSYVTLREEGVLLRGQNCELRSKLTYYCTRVTELQDQLNELQRSLDEMVSDMSLQVESLRGEMGQQLCNIEGELNSTHDKVAQMVEKLVATAGQPYFPLTKMGDDLNFSSWISVFVDSACGAIKDLKKQLDATSKEHEACCALNMEMSEKFDAFRGEHQVTVALLHKISSDLAKLLRDSSLHVPEFETKINQNSLGDPLDASHIEAVVRRLGNLLDELKESNDKIRSELLNQTTEVEELRRNCIDSVALLKLVDNVTDVLKLQDEQSILDKPPFLRLQSSVMLLVQKCKADDQDTNLLRDGVNSRMLQLNGLQEQIEHLSCSNFQQQNENIILKESLGRMKQGFDALHVELEEKMNEVEQSEQRVVSLREKLSIAVTKGKGLIVQRDNLKQSLAETSSELERCLQELRLKDARLNEVEEKLKSYSESGERVEALESELSYIRNSATALRESFLHKDSSLQRIEEILEDLELPEHFHSQDIIEKVNWLAKFVASNSTLPADWEQRSPIVGGSYSDTGSVVMDAWKENQMPNSNTDDFRRKYDELLTKFYELAEQNDMLEQSLMERNNLVQRWEEVLARICIPQQLQSMEPEERIAWLGNALSEADHLVGSLQQKIDGLENYCKSLSVDLEKAHRRVEELEASLNAVVDEKENISGKLAALTSEHVKALENIAELEQDTNQLRGEIDSLQGKLIEKLGLEEHSHQLESGMSRLQELVVYALQDPEEDNTSSDNNGIKSLERLLRRLIKKYSGVKEAVEKSEHSADLDELIAREAASEQSYDCVVAGVDQLGSRDIMVDKEQNPADLRVELDGAMGELSSLREERDEYMAKCQSLASDIQALEKKNEELLELLSQEEQKAASLREKLNIAVRKGKTLVQQRDGLKQNLEEMSLQVDRLNSELNLRQSAISVFEQKLKDMHMQVESKQALESDNIFLKNQMIEVEQCLQERERALNLLFERLSKVSVGWEVNFSDPVQKLDSIVKLCVDLHSAVATSEHEMKKSKRAADLLLAELNEVQEHNDNLQEQLSKAHDEISNLSQERDVAECAKLEAFSQIDKLFEERKTQLAELEALKCSVHELEKGFSDVDDIIADIFTKDVELLQKLTSVMESCLKQINFDMPLPLSSGNLISTNLDQKDFLAADSCRKYKMQNQFNGDAGIVVCDYIGQHLQLLMDEICNFKRRMYYHSTLLREESGQLIDLFSHLQKEVLSQKESLELKKGEILRLESTQQEKDMESAVLYRSIAMLSEACTSTVMEIESRKALLVGNRLANGDPASVYKSLESVDGVSKQTLSSVEGHAKSLADRLLLAAKEIVGIQAEAVESHHKELRATILNLQKELQEKEIQKDRISMQFVGQIREAEVAAANYSQELHSTRNHLSELEKRLEAMVSERSFLENRISELQQRQTDSVELVEKFGSMTATLAAKDQEIEALMQALEEEENQMEDLRNQVEELEKSMRWKTFELEKAEASRAKAVKKLSITMSKFDELHHMSEGLLAEIENLQSQLHEQDSEISFLRQEVTRCTDDAILASKMRKEINSDEFNEFLTQLDTIVSRVLMREVHDGDDKGSSNHKEYLQNDISSIISELEDLKVVSHRKDALLQSERSRVEELLHREAALEVALREKESYLRLLEDAGDLRQSDLEIVDVEPMVSKRAVASAASQVRSLRKANNNDQVSIAIGSDSGRTGRLEDEDDDKIHGFKSLTTLRFVPKCTRPVTNMIDGLWVSCDRTLMRQPAFRLSIMIYWALLHALLAASVF